MSRVPWSKSKIYRDMKTGKFPPQAEKLEGSTSAGWHEDAIDALVESLRPKLAAKDQSKPGIEVSQSQVAKLDQPLSGPPLKPGPELAPQRRAVKAAEDGTLIRTGIKLHGEDVFCHLPSRRLLVSVGSISDEYLASLTKLSA